MSAPPPPAPGLPSRPQMVDTRGTPSQATLQNLSFTEHVSPPPVKIVRSTADAEPVAETRIDVAMHRPPTSALNGPDDEPLDQLMHEIIEEEGGAEHVRPAEEEETGAENVGVKTVPPEFLCTDPSIGLTAAQVAERKKKFGPNQLTEERENQFLKFLSFFLGPIQYVMWIAVCLAGGLREWVDFGVIIGLLMLNAVVGFVQEYQAGNIVEQLKKGFAPIAHVIRDGTRSEIPAEQVVPGDILVLEEGTIIPADGKVIGPLHTFSRAPTALSIGSLRSRQSDGLAPPVQRMRAFSVISVQRKPLIQVDQSALTGESLAVSKHQDDDVFSSSTVKRGDALVIATATGDMTFLGRAARLVAASAGGEGHFTQVIKGIGVILVLFVVVFIAIIWISGFYRGIGIVDLLVYSLILLIIGVPVGLPAVVTTTMAVGAAEIAKRQAIVQKLSAIESLAGVEVLCSDKTGTLTTNKLTVHEPFVVETASETDLMLCAALACSHKKQGMDPIDRAMIKSLFDYPEALDAAKKYKTISFQPFDPVSKRVTAIVLGPDGRRMTCAKGAPNAILKLIREHNAVPPEIEQEYNEKVAEFASRGFRSLGVAWQGRQGNEEWELLGIVPLFDPPRFDTARTIAEAQDLGVQVKMLTGDAVGIAKETARQLSLGTKIFNAESLGLGAGGTSTTMPASELYDFVEAADGFAEVYPEHKYRVVEILQQRGRLVGMTGDGVNDAPSLKKADAGIAVEGATSAARSAADIVFIAPGLGTIIDALKTSRKIFHRMEAYIIYRIALSLHLEIFLMTSLVILDRTIDVELVVFLAIFADIATLAIAYDNAPYSQLPCKWNLPRIWGQSIILGALLAVSTWIMYTATMPTGGNTYAQNGVIQNFGTAQSILFLQVALNQNWLIFITRAEGFFWSSLPSWQLTGAVLVVDALATVFCLFGWFVGPWTDIVTTVKVWIYALFVFFILAGVFVLTQQPWFDRLMHGRLKDSKKRRDEDLMLAVARLSAQHEKAA